MIEDITVLYMGEVGWGRDEQVGRKDQATCDIQE
jgi:hypothetical protein